MQNWFEYLASRSWMYGEFSVNFLRRRRCCCRSHGCRRRTSVETVLDANNRGFLFAIHVTYFSVWQSLQTEAGFDEHDQLTVVLLSYHTITMVYAWAAAIVPWSRRRATRRSYGWNCGLYSLQVEQKVPKFFPRSIYQFISCNSGMWICLNSTILACTRYAAGGHCSLIIFWGLAE